MKLIYRIISRLSIALLVLMTAWAMVFYFIIVEEINDETDDALEDYSEYIIMRVLAGEELPSEDNGTNNSYHKHEVTPEYAQRRRAVEYFDEEMYVYSRKEMEPARVLRTIFKDADDRYMELTVSIPTFDKSDLQETILLWLVLLYIVLLLAVIAVNAWILYRSFRPLYTLLEWLDGLTLGAEVPPLENDTDITEFRKLNQAMLHNAERNSEMYEEQRNFIGNASHELQTPVAVCRNRLEMLVDDPSLDERQLGEIMKTQQALDHISRLNKTLLLLTKIDNMQFPDSAQICVNDLLKSIVSDSSEIYSGHEVETVFAEDTQLRVVMNETLASVLFGNLVKNAFVYTPQGGLVEIAIGPGRVAISNTAAAEGLDPRHIFKRFFRGSDAKGGSGLGLSLVESICRMYGMQVSYEYENGRHKFTVDIPPGLAGKA